MSLPEAGHLHDLPTGLRDHMATLSKANQGHKCFKLPDCARTKAREPAESAKPQSGGALAPSTWAHK
jgi:hypothetical protein